MAQSKLEELFQSKSPLGILASMALPTVASQLIGVIYNYADSIYVGWLNHPEQVAAIALALPLMLLTTALANFWGVGGGSALSRALGCHDRGKAAGASAFSIYSSIAVSLLLSLIAWLWGDGFIRLLGASDTVLPYARDYFFWFFIVGGLPAVLSMVLAHFVRAEGYARLAGLGLMLGGLLNVVLDPLFIFPVGLGMGVAGAAMATALSNTVSVLFFCAAIWRNRNRTSLSFRLSALRVSWELAREIMLVGLPSALLMLLSAISNNVLNSLVASHGDRAIAAVGIAKKMDVLPAHVSMGITQGALPVMAYAYASGQHQKMKEFLFTTLKLSFCVLAILVGLLEIFAGTMATLFIRDPQTVAYATSFIRILCLAVPLYALSTTINSFYQAINRPKTAFALSLIRKGFLDIPLMILLNALFFVTNVIWAQPILDLVTAAVSFAVIHKTLRDAKD